MVALAGDIKPPRNAVELEVEDVVPTDRNTNVLLLLHREDHTIVPIQVGESEAISIAFRLADKARDRPLTHDLFDRTLFELGARVVQVHIHELENEQYHARITLDRGLKGKRRHRVYLDARASDAAAIALGNGLPIYMDVEVYERVGLTVDAMIEKLEQQSALNP